MMNKKLKNGLLGTSILLLFFLAFSQGCTASPVVPPALPMLPMQVTGVALIDGTPAPNGTVIAAYLNDKEYLANTSSGKYSLFIHGIAEDKGKLVTFKVDGKDATSSAAWESGSIVSLELPDGKVVYTETTESNSNNGSNGNSNSNTKSNSNSKTGSEPLTDNKKQEVSSEDPKVEVIKTSIPEPNITALKNTGANSEDKEAAESSENSPKPESTPGFLIFYAVAGILLLAFGFDLGRGSRKNP
jgi:hypothetical protein